MPASSSMATSWLTMASLRASRRAPTAIVTDSTVGMATGMAATVKTRANCKAVLGHGSSSMGSPRNSATVRMRITRARAMTMR